MSKSAVFTVTTQPLQETRIAAQTSNRRADGTLFIDFGKAMFATLEIRFRNLGVDRTIQVQLGEKTVDGEVMPIIDREPVACIRSLSIGDVIAAGTSLWRAQIPADERNTGPAGIKMPAEIGEVYPFRYVEIADAHDIDPADVRQVAVHYPFNDEAADFSCSDETLNAVWDICKHTIKATTFCGIYVDGDRERIPYEGDAYINQLCHYCVDQEYAFARYSHEYLLQYPTWPTEWQMHSVMMAWMDYLYTGETESIEMFFDTLQAKTLFKLAREDGLISTQSDLCTRAFEESLNFYNDRFIFNHGLRDLVDWPPGSFTAGGIGERDDHEMLPVNTVVNAFHYHALSLMAKMSTAIGKTEKSAYYTQQSQRVYKTFNALLFNHAEGVYRDGEGSTHASLHSNMWALAFGLVPAEHQKSVVTFVKSRGMACSVYGAQYLLEALYLHGGEQAALELMRARHDRSWWNMIAAGSSMTLEAWDYRYKNNLDWNHAWGAAPANIIPRYVMGIRPMAPGFQEVLIQPNPADLKQARVKHPSPFGPITVTLETEDSGVLRMDVDVPQGVCAYLESPRREQCFSKCIVNGEPIQLSFRDQRAILPALQAGSYHIQFS